MGFDWPRPRPLSKGQGGAEASGSGQDEGECLSSDEAPSAEVLAMLSPQLGCRIRSWGCLSCSLPQSVSNRKENTGSYQHSAQCLG